MSRPSYKSRRQADKACLCFRINHPSRALYDIWVVSYPDQQGARYNDSAGSLRELRQTTNNSLSQSKPPTSFITVSLFNKYGRGYDYPTLISTGFQDALASKLCLIYTCFPNMDGGRGRHMKSQQCSSVSLFHSAKCT